jgi:hypothetical protein
MRDLTSVKQAVSETFSHLFSHVRVCEVRVREDTDFDGEDILRIDVIYDGTVKDLDGKKLAGFTGLLEPKLEQIHEPALPLLSFISRADFYRNKRAPA